MSRPISKDWMNERDRFSDAYQKGVAGFIDFAKQNNKEGLETCFCPCKKCLNKSRVPFIRLKNHLVTEGIDPKYQKWVFHGEKSYTPPTLGEDREEIRQRLGNFVDDCYGIDGRAVADADGSVDEQEGDFEEEYLPEPDLPKRYSKYKRLAEEKLYPECEGDETTLSAIVELHNVKKLFGWSGASVTYLLRILKRWLPKGNTLPSKYPEMKAMIKDLGMDVKRIDVCENNCILYWKENKDATECPQCKAPRYKVKLGKKGKVVSKEANKVLRHFPLASRLKRLYTIPWIANEMTWHDRATASKTLMRHPIDSVQWQSTKDKWPEFAIEKRNAWCAIATDGFNPRGIQSTSYSCWPVFTITYNLPPSLCMKEEFQMMSLLIPGPKAPGQDIDVFLEPLFDEFDQLWESGELAYDMHDMQPFTLRALLLWGIHDFPAYGNLSGSITHGYKACPCCGDETPSVRTPVTKKIVYLDFRRFLTMDHPFRLGGRFGFKTAENRIPPQPLSGSRLLEALSHVHYIPGKISKGTKRPCANANEIEEADGSESEVGTDAWYRKSLLYKLKYWPGHKIRHVLDVMHVEKNVSEHILHMLLDKDNKTKDTVNAREDMRLMGIHQGQWMTTHKVTGELTKPIAPYDMISEDRRIFFQTLRDLKLPSGFSSNLSNIVNPNLSGLLVMKSHDHHVILEYLLPVLLQHAFPKHRNMRRALHQISLFFRILCSKVLFRQEIKDAKNMVIAALSVLESLFPPSFFDISIHLVAHLADEALMCGPVHPRWMYPFERAMKECKDIPSNKRYVEGSIAESYLVSESIRYAMEYMPNKHGGDSYSRREAFLDEDGIYGPNGGPILAGNPVILKPEQFVQIRRWLLFRVDDVPLLDEYYSQYRNDVEPITRGRGKHTVTEVEIQTKFIEWLYEKLLEEGSTSGILWRLVKGPLFDAKTYRKYRINGFVFSPKYHDDTVSTQDSGVCMKAITTFRSSRRDKNLIDAEIMWYGIIKEILEVDYIEFKEVIFYCDWVKVEDKANGCKICQDSNLMTVNLNNLKKSDHVLSEPAILASEASQVFYSRDLKNPNWWVVIHSPSRLKSQVDQLDVPLDVRSILADEPHLKYLMEGVH